MADPTQLVEREAARVLLLDQAGNVLMMHGFDPARPEVPAWWFTPGGGIEAGESAETAARRELLEETGLDSTALDGPVGDRTSEFELDGIRFRQHDVYFVARTERFEPASDAWTDLERRSLLGTRWWSVDELRSTSETVYPETLLAMLSEALG